MIYVDDREPPEMAQMVPNGVPVHVMRLDVGDFMFFVNGPGGKMWCAGVERKTLGDFVSSVQSGHLPDQLRRMAEVFDVYWLIIEGVSRINSNGEIDSLRSGAIENPSGKKIGGTWESVTQQRRPIGYLSWEGWKTSYECMGGVKIRTSRNKYETMRVVVALWSWGANKEWEEHRSMSKPFTSFGGLVRPNLLMKWLTSLDGVGEKRAREAAKHFGSALAVANAEVEDWLQVGGIGKKTAQKIVESIRKGGAR